MTHSLVTVPFRGDAIPCVETPSGVYVAVILLCERLGVSRQMQQRKLNARPDLWLQKLMMLETPAGTRETICIPLTRVAMWLASISPRKVKAEVREALIAYQIEAADVLDGHFRGLMRDEVLASNRRLERLREELIARKPLWVKVRSWQAMGWGFDEIWRASKRSRAVVAEAIGDLMSCDLIPAAPTGMPGTAAASQLSLFAIEG